MMGNLFSSPESYGLEIVSVLDDPTASYSFDMLVVWKDSLGLFYWATDAGCSCPSPFENYLSLTDLSPLVSETWNEFAEAVDDHCAAYDYHFGDSPPDGRDWRYDGDIQIVTNKKTTSRWTLRKPDPDDLACDKTELLAEMSALVPQGPLEDLHEIVKRLES